MNKIDKVPGLPDYTVVRETDNEQVQVSINMIIYDSKNCYKDTKTGCGGREYLRGECFYRIDKKGFSPPMQEWILL